MTKILIALFSTLLAGQAWADAPTRKDAVALVERAAAVVAKNGSKAFVDAVNAGKPEWSNKDLFVVVYDAGATVMANGMNTKLVGKNVLEVPDVEGKYFRKEIVAGAKDKGSGWSEYKFKNPESGKVEHKITYYKKAGDLIILAGVFADTK
jgi:cytochrome c